MNKNWKLAVLAVLAVVSLEVGLPTSITSPIFSAILSSFSSDSEASSLCKNETSVGALRPPCSYFNEYRCRCVYCHGYSMTKFA